MHFAALRYYIHSCSFYYWSSCEFQRGFKLSKVVAIYFLLFSFMSLCCSIKPLESTTGGFIAPPPHWRDSASVGAAEKFARSSHWARGSRMYSLSLRCPWTVSIALGPGSSGANLGNTLIHVARECCDTTQCARLVNTCIRPLSSS